MKSDEQPDRMEIAIAGDSNYLVPMTVLLASLFANNSDVEITVNFLYFEPAIKEKEVADLQKFIESRGHRLCRLPVTEKEMERLPETRCSKSTYLRLLLPEILPDEVEKVLYLDGDMVVCGSLKPVWNTDLAGFYLAVVKEEKELPDRHKECHRQIGFPEGATYFNAGMLLMNIERMRREGITELFLECIGKHSDWLLFGADQDVLNLTLHRAVTCLPPIYNHNVCTEPDIAGWYSFSKGKPSESHRRPVVIHYIWSLKPWHYLSTHPYRSLWWKYLKLTPFNKDFRRKNITVKHRLYRFARYLVPRSLKSSFKPRHKRMMERLLGLSTHSRDSRSTQ